MAGYRAPGDRFINATTKNDQMDDQRRAYQARVENSNSERGIARPTTPLFRMPEDIFEASTGIFSLLDLAVESGNPDFGPSNTMSNIPGTSEMFNNVSAQVDKPNRKGPNLIAPDINDTTFSNDERQESQFTNRGFGWRDSRNDPGSAPSRIGEYFSKHYSVQGPSGDSPIFGEAKSPEPDPNIDYDQP